MTNHLDWQPIETVPADVPVLVFYDGKFVVTSWDTSLNPHWRGYPWLEPTHWQPLPPPPGLSTVEHLTDTIKSALMQHVTDDFEYAIAEAALVDLTRIARKTKTEPIQRETWTQGVLGYSDTTGDFRGLTELLTGFESISHLSFVQLGDGRFVVVVRGVKLA